MGHLRSTLRDHGTDEQATLDIISRINLYASDIIGDVGVDG